jgi:hypothetical protein
MMEFSVILSAEEDFNLHSREPLLWQLLYIMGSSRSSLGIAKDLE